MGRIRGRAGRVAAWALAAQLGCGTIAGAQESGPAAARDEAQTKAAEVAKTAGGAEAEDAKLRESLAAAERRVAELEKELATREEETKGLRPQLLAARNDLSSVELRLAAKTKEFDALAAAAREMVAREEALAAEKEAVRRDLAQAQTVLAAVRDDLASARSQLAAKTREAEALAATEKELAAVRGELARTQDELAAARAAAAQQEQQSQELRSELEAQDGLRRIFFSKLRETLGPGSGVVVENQRFVFPSDVTFAPGSAALDPAARSKVVEIGRALAEAAAALPPETDWLLRVDGHTDRTRVGGRVFASNRALSVARALSVVDALAEGGVPPSRIAPAGFGEFRPIDATDTPEGRRRNRRIELVVDGG